MRISVEQLISKLVILFLLLIWSSVRLAYSVEADADALYVLGFTVTTIAVAAMLTLALASILLIGARLMAAKPGDNRSRWLSAFAAWASVWAVVWWQASELAIRTNVNTFQAFGYWASIIAVAFWYALPGTNLSSEPAPPQASSSAIARLWPRLLAVAMVFVLFLAAGWVLAAALALSLLAALVLVDAISGRGYVWNLFQRRPLHIQPISRYVAEGQQEARDSPQPTMKR